MLVLTYFIVLVYTFELLFDSIVETTLKCLRCTFAHPSSCPKERGTESCVQPSHISHKFGPWLFGVNLQ